MLPRLLLLVLPWAALAVPGAARAELPRRAVLAPPELGALADAVAAELDHDFPAQSLTASSQAGPEVAAHIAAEVSRAVALTEAGKVALDDLELPKARALLNEAVPILGAYASRDPRAKALVVEAWFNLAVTILYADDHELADAHFAAIHAAEKGFLPEPGRYPSKVVRRFLAAPVVPATLELSCPEEGAQFQVAGQVGAASSFSIPAGVHLVVVEKPGFWPKAEFAFVEADPPAVLELTLEPDPVRLWALSTLSQDDAAIRAQLGAEEIVRLESYGLDGARASWAAPALDRSVSVKGATSAVGTLLVHAWTVASRPPPPPPTPLVEEPLFWTIAIASVVAIGGGIAIGAAAAGASGDSRPPPGTATLGF